MHYFFGTKVHDETTRPFATHSIAICTKWTVRSKQTSCCEKLTTQSDSTSSINNKPKIVYVCPTTHKEKVLNAVVIKSTAIYNHLRKKLEKKICFR